MEVVRNIKNVVVKINRIFNTQLAQLMIDHNFGVTFVQNCKIKRINSVYFDENLKRPKWKINMIHN